MLALPQCELALHCESGGVQVLEGDFWFRPSPRDEALSASGMEAEDQLPDPARLVTAIRHRRPVWATIRIPWKRVSCRVNAGPQCP